MNDPKGILDEVKKAVVGKDGVLVMALLAILAGGHILLEDIPGVGKTTMALAFSKALSLKYNRVQFTPDVLPSDIVGFSVYNKATGAMEYKDGAILCNLFLADELNRATSRTQSALLEAMEERTVTVDGVTHPVPDPFVVIATQNPVGASGTQLLPDSQMDRFMVRLSLGYPKPSDEKEMLTRKQQGNPLEKVRCMADKGSLAAMRQECERTYVSEKILEYIIRLNNATRNNPAILQGAS
ncbi:MAG: AAA family ATPase, partial [Clostridia bacterium]|nr:AAA family ATPase [Clostridia bacterium]